MWLSSTAKVLMRHLHVVLIGLLLSVAAGGTVLTIVPRHYTSEGIAVLVNPKPPRANTANPLLTFQPSLNMTALMLAQALSSPTIPGELGLAERTESFTVKNAGGVTAGAAG